MTQIELSVAACDMRELSREQLVQLAARYKVTLERIGAGDPGHSQFAVLAVNAARDALAQS